jgi:hypothetical protein
MGANVNHVHLKTKDSIATAKHYVDNFGARIKQRIPGRGLQIDLHGLQLNLTTLIKEKIHEQHYGIEHTALTVDDSSGASRSSGPTGSRCSRSCRPTTGECAFPRQQTARRLS